MVTFEQISPADFFYRNRDIAGFTNPARAIFSSVRELVENSLDASDQSRVPSNIYLRLSDDGEKSSEEADVYKLRVEDNGSGIPARHIPSAFGQVLFGSKYKLKQARGTFGLGGTMAILYGQITTHKPVRIASSTGSSRIYRYKLMIDIQRNRPVILDRKIQVNKDRWRGTVVEFCLEGDYPRAMSRILEYLKQTAVVTPYANITFVDPKGRLYKFTRVTSKVPRPPKETLPHPHGVDVETLRRLILITKCRNMVDFMKTHFHRIGNRTARNFLKFAEIDETKNPRKLEPDEIVKLVRKMKKYDKFRSPDAGCLSPLGAELLKAGILKELEPEFIAVCQRKPSTYSGHPFVVETAIAYGGNVPRKDDIVLYRFANRIPLLYDEASDVSWRIIKSINWRKYKITLDMPVAILVHLCSTKVPYKTVGKEFIADRPEVKNEVLNGVREVARQLRRFLSKREYREKERKRLATFSKYLPKIAKFSTELSGKEKEPDIRKLLWSVRKFEEEKE
ncbi:MAG: DNA topoisomerase VI subunit B [Candidatus Bathyarchaeota archaeon]|nr:MAG: DNA topoisomerase VI subunit B [Candidatus Bathyarchaeota archaeon]